MDPTTPRCTTNARCAPTAIVDERSNRLGNALAARGVAEGDVVALMCRNHGAMVEAMIACGKIGADVVLLNTGLSASAVAKVISQHRPSVVFADDEFAATIDAAHGHFLRLCTWPDRELGYPTVDELISTASPEKLTPVERPGRIIVLTSGTTGLPKGARRPTPKGLSTAAAMLARIPLRAGDRLLVAAPLFHTWGLAAMQLGMALRASLSLVSKFDPEETLRTIAEHRARRCSRCRSCCTGSWTCPSASATATTSSSTCQAVRGRYDLDPVAITAETIETAIAIQSRSAISPASRSVNILA